MFQTNQATFFLGKSLFFEGAKSLTSFDPLRYQSTWLLKKSLRWDSALSAFGHANRPLGGALRA